VRTISLNDYVVCCIKSTFHKFSSVGRTHVSCTCGILVLGFESHRWQKINSSKFFCENYSFKWACFFASGLHQLHLTRPLFSLCNVQKCRLLSKQRSMSTWQFKKINESITIPHYTPSLPLYNLIRMFMYYVPSLIPNVLSLSNCQVKEQWGLF
jgi:hypothetical protein